MALHNRPARISKVTQPQHGDIVNLVEGRGTGVRMLWFYRCSRRRDFPAGSGPDRRDEGKANFPVYRRWAGIGQTPRCAGVAKARGLLGVEPGSFAAGL